MSDYIPTTDEVRFAMAGLRMSNDRFVTRESFDRWLDKVKADAFDEGVSECSSAADYRFDVERQGRVPVKNPYRKETK